jgi:hypothetical protein
MEIRLPAGAARGTCRQCPCTGAGLSEGMIAKVGSRAEALGDFKCDNRPCWGVKLHNRTDLTPGPSTATMS